MEGPQFSTVAESRLYKSWGMDVIGMTNLQEAKLAREAEICYTTIALVTDYDCWHPETDNVTVEMIVSHRRSGRPGAFGTRMSVRRRSGDFDYYQSERGSRSHQARSGSDHRQIPEVRPA
jgi:hypothetical protein